MQSKLSLGEDEVVQQLQSYVEFARARASEPKGMEVQDLGNFIFQGDILVFTPEAGLVSAINYKYRSLETLKVDDGNIASLPEEQMEGSDPVETEETATVEASDEELEKVEAVEEPDAGAGATDEPDVAATDEQTESSSETVPVSDSEEEIETESNQIAQAATDDTPEEEPEQEELENPEIISSGQTEESKHVIPPNSMRMQLH